MATALVTTGMVRLWEHCPSDPSVCRGASGSERGQVPGASVGQVSVRAVVGAEVGRRTQSPSQAPPSPRQLQVAQAGRQRAGQGPDT